MSSRLPICISVMVLLALTSIGCAPQANDSPPVKASQSADETAPTAPPSDADEKGRSADESAATKAEAQTDLQTEELEAAAKAFIGQLVNEQFAEATNDFDDTMKEVMPAEELQKTWTTLIAQAGKLKSQGRVTHTKLGEYDVVSVTCTFERAPLDVETSFNTKRQISGLFFRPTKPAPRPKDARTSAELKTDSGTLYGTFDRPDGSGPFPVVVIIAGSGPTDRDGNQPLMQNDHLKLLGSGLASRGIATLRYDKRMIGESTHPEFKEEDMRFATYVDDAAAWVEQVRTDERFCEKVLERCQQK